MTAGTLGAPRGAAPAHRRVRAQAGMELRLLARNAENLLVTLGIPVGVLVLFSLVPVLPTDGRPAVAFLLPGVLTIALMGSALVSLSITTGFERSYLVLKRLGATPLRRGELIVAKVLAIAVVELVQVAVLIATAIALGWRPRQALLGADAPLWSAPRPVVFALALLLGTAAFAGIGLAMAGRLRALTTLALSNAVFIFLMLASGLVFPLELLPAPLQTLMGLLPAAPLTEVLAVGLEGAGAVPPARALTVLTAWALAAPMVAAQLFRWE